MLVQTVDFELAGVRRVAVDDLALTSRKNSGDPRRFKELLPVDSHRM